MGNDNVLDVDPDGMMDEANQFDDINGIADGIASTLINAMHGLGPFWGNDPVGRQFAENWTPTIGGMHDGLGGVGSNMADIGDNLRTSAQLFDNSNGINTEMGGGLVK
jgi:uncharacterized protein YukE